MSSQPVSAWCPPGVLVQNLTSAEPARATPPSKRPWRGRLLSRTHQHLGARYRRLARRIGKQKGQVAVAGSILVTVRKLLADPTRQHDAVGPEFYDHRIGPERHQRNHIHKLETLGYTVTLNPAA